MGPDEADSQVKHVDELLREGIAATKAGQRNRAHGLLIRVLEQDKDNIPAWLWLSGVVDSLEDRERCLGRVLVLDPDNAAARKGLAWIRQQKEAQASPSAVEVPSLASSPEAPPAELADAGCVSSATPGEFDDEYLCPYCAAPTEPDDRRCRACGGDLWVRFRRQEGRSNALWFAIGAQAASLIRNASAFIPVLTLTQFLTGASDIVALTRAYLGLPSDLPSEATGVAFALLPRPVFLGYAFSCLFSLVVMVGLLSCWKPMFYLYLADAVMNLVTAVASLSLRGVVQDISTVLPPTGFVFFYLTSMAGVFLALLKGYLASQIQDDFFLSKRRILLRTDPGLTDSVDFVAHADSYTKRKMWAMAAVHLQEAVDLAPDRLDCRLALAAAYVGLKRYDQADRELAEAGHISPGDPRVRELEALLNELRSEGVSS